MPPTISDPIDRHIAEIIADPKYCLRIDNISKLTTVMINLYKKFTTKEPDLTIVSGITSQDLKLLQIIGLFIEKNGYNVANSEACQKYLRELGLEEEEAKQLASIIADGKTPPFDQLEGKYKFFAKILYDANKLTLASFNRARMDQLCFFKENVTEYTTEETLSPGSKKAKTNKALKALSAIFMDIRDKNKNVEKKSMFKVFFNEGQLLPAEQANRITTRIKTQEISSLLSSIEHLPETDPRLINALPTLMEMGMIFMRTVSGSIEGIDAELHPLKTQGVNHSRSASTMGHGSLPFFQGEGFGLVIVNTDHKHIKQIANSDLFSGGDEKEEWKSVEYLLPHDAKFQLKKLRGEALAERFRKTHNEVILDISAKDKMYVMLYERNPNAILKSIVMQQKLKETPLKKDTKILWYSQDSNQLLPLDTQKLLVEYVKNKMYKIYEAHKDNPNMFDMLFVEAQIRALFQELTGLNILPTPLTEKFFNAVSQGANNIEDFAKHIINNTFPTLSDLKEMLNIAVTTNDLLTVQRIIQRNSEVFTSNVDLLRRSCYLFANYFEQGGRVAAMEYGKIIALNKDIIAIDLLRLCAKHQLNDGAVEQLLKQSILCTNISFWELQKLVGLSRLNNIEDILVEEILLFKFLKQFTTTLELTSIDTKLLENFLQTQFNKSLNKKNIMLTSAAKSGHLQVVKFLIQNGADINAVDNNGDTALMLAVKSRDLATIKFLTDNGADIYIANNNGDTALTLAASTYDNETIKILNEKIELLQASQEQEILANLAAKMDTINIELAKTSDLPPTKKESVSMADFTETTTNVVTEKTSILTPIVFTIDLRKQQCLAEVTKKYNSLFEEIKIMDSKYKADQRKTTPKTLSYFEEHSKLTQELTKYYQYMNIIRNGTDGAGHPETLTIDKLVEIEKSVGMHVSEQSLPDKHLQKKR